MSWTINNKGECNNSNCRQEIYWNPLVRHNVTKRQRALNQPYYPDQAAKPDIHQCMKNNPPPAYINKYEYDYRGMPWFYRHGYPESKVRVEWGGIIY